MRQRLKLAAKCSGSRVRGVSPSTRPHQTWCEPSGDHDIVVGLVVAPVVRGGEPPVGWSSGYRALRRASADAHRELAVVPWCGNSTCAAEFMRERVQTCGKA
jgi:hypothetical protein